MNSIIRAGLGLILFSLFSVGAYAQNKVVVVPMGADAIVPGTEKIPLGATVTGFATWDHGVLQDDEDIIFFVPFPGRAPQDLSSVQVNFAPHANASDDDITCTGTASAPTAPAGKVCIYISAGTSFDGAGGFSTETPGFLDVGFLVQFRTNSVNVGNDMYIRVTWAYTAPSSVSSLGLIQDHNPLLSKGEESQ